MHDTISMLLKRRPFQTNHTCELVLLPVSSDTSSLLSKDEYNALLNASVYASSSSANCFFAGSCEESKVQRLTSLKNTFFFKRYIDGDLMYLREQRWTFEVAVKVPNQIQALSFHLVVVLQRRHLRGKKTRVNHTWMENVKQSIHGPWKIWTWKVLRGIAD